MTSWIIAIFAMDYGISTNDIFEGKLHHLNLSWYNRLFYILLKVAIACCWSFVFITKDVRVMLNLILFCIDSSLNYIIVFECCCIGERVWCLMAHWLDESNVMTHPRYEPLQAFNRLTSRVFLEPWLSPYAYNTLTTSNPPSIICSVKEHHYA